jgi:hypothetical protein
VDDTHVLAMGVSTGGFTSVALTAMAPPGLVAAINFAGGRGSKADHDVCNPDDLVHAYRSVPWPIHEVQGWGIFDRYNGEFSTGIDTCATTRLPNFPSRPLAIRQL